MNNDDLDSGATLRGFTPGQRVFNRYVLTRVLGQGGMGIVWLARDEKLEQEIALKFLPDAVARDAEAIRDLKRETRKALRLTHPRIVRIHDFVDDARMAAVSMEYVEGRTLSALKLEKPEGCFEAAELTPWVGQICEALTYAHGEAKIAHRDLKPANIMIDKSGMVKVADFGISATITDTTSRTSTNAGSSSGTPVYMSPQQMMGEKPAPTDDIYSLGATIYELLTGKPPFYSGNIMAQVQNKVPPSMTERRKELGVENAAPIPEAWEATVASCLAKDAAQRPQSAAEVWALLEGDEAQAAKLREMTAETARKSPDDLSAGETVANVARSNLSTESGNVRTEKPQAPARKSKGPLYGALAAGVLAVAACGWWFGVHMPDVRRAAETARMESEGRAAEAMKLRNADERAEAERKAKETQLAAERAAAEKAEQERLKKEAEKTRQEEARIAALRGGLIVRTNPAGAEVRVGAVAFDKSPLTAKDMKLGKYPVRIHLEGYEDWSGETEVGKADDFSELTVNLVRQTGTLEITSEPAGMKWEMIESPEGGTIATKCGVTPIEIKEAPTGSYTIRYRREGWPDIAREVKIEKAGNITANADFAYGSLKLESEPTGAPVFDATGKALGKTPLTVDGLIPGKHEFLITENGMGYRTTKVEVETDCGKTATRVVKLDAYNGPERGKNWTVPEYAIDMVWINPGSFMMGLRKQDKQKYDSKENIGQHPVTLTKGYWLGKYEVTQRQWQAVMGNNPSSFQNAGADHPVETVSWEDAQEFCKKLTKKERAAGRLPGGYEYSLPTEAQWEYACRAGTTGKYGGNGDLKSMGWYDKNSGYTTPPVGQKQANAWGLYDMHGNVWEWCNDWYGDYPSGAATDPTGPNGGTSRVIRGGGWDYDASSCRSAYRGGLAPVDRYNFLGFRLALRSVQ